MSGTQRVNDTVGSQDPGYEWSYEYYDYEDPGSFEGLSAHRYSIVIVFWVGLAVFVIFMFFVLTLLAKTRAPHPDGREAAVKRGGHLAARTEQLHLHALQRNVSFPSKPLLQESSSRSVLRCQVHEEEEGEEEEEAGKPGGSGATARSAACGGPGAGAANAELRVGLTSGGGAACDGQPGPPSCPAAPGTSAATAETPENFDIPNVVH